MIDYQLLFYGGTGWIGAIVLAADLGWLVWRAVRAIVRGPK